MEHKDPLVMMNDTDHLTDEDAAAILSRMKYSQKKQTSSDDSTAEIPSLDIQRPGASFTSSSNMIEFGATEKEQNNELAMTEFGATEKEQNNELAMTENDEDLGGLKGGKKGKVNFLMAEENINLAMMGFRTNEKDEEDVKSKNFKRKQILSADCEKKKKRIESSGGTWSTTRYEEAERTILNILQEKGALLESPVTRTALQKEAANLIRDTGLLNHLLKHIVGKKAPGGKEMVRRRTKDGVTVYWLEESPDLDDDIRKQAGVQDPNRTPPPSWTLGDNPAQHPVSARKRWQLKQDMAKFGSCYSEFLSKKREDDMAIVTAPTSRITCQTLEPNSFFHPSKETYMESGNKKALIDKQLKEISHALLETKTYVEEQCKKMSHNLEEIGKLMTLEEANKPESNPKQPLLVESTTPAQPSTGIEKETKEVELKNQHQRVILSKKQKAKEQHEEEAENHERN